MDTITKTAENVRQQLVEFGNSVADFGSNAASSFSAAASNAATTAVETTRERVLEANRFAAANIERLADWLPNADVKVPDMSDTITRLFEAQRKVLDANQQLAEDVLKIWQGAPKPAATTAAAKTAAKPAARKRTAASAK